MRAGLLPVITMQTVRSTCPHLYVKRNIYILYIPFFKMTWCLYPVSLNAAHPQRNQERVGASAEAQRGAHGLPGQRRGHHGPQEPGGPRGAGGPRAGETPGPGGPPADPVRIGCNIAHDSGSLNVVDQTTSNDLLLVSYDTLLNVYCLKSIYM